MAEHKKPDYLVLVNRDHKVPDNWLDTVEFVETKNTIPEGVELNENTSYLATQTFKLEKKTMEAFRALQTALKEEGITILLDSTYRSVQDQKDIWDLFEKLRGIDYVRQYAAVPGTSEHHTGLAIDVCAVKDGRIINDNDEMIAEEELFSRIHKRLPEFGLILRGPKGKEDIIGYAAEPWHFRYVGVEAAKEMAEHDFVLEEYLDWKSRQ